LSYSFVTTLLRGELSFDGLVITDDLEMGAIINNFGISEACKMALAAGADMVAICAEPVNIRTGHRALTAAIETGEIDPGRSLDRIAAAKSTLRPPLPFDLSRLEALSVRTEALVSRLSR
jgi:beta-N-acetylhexosaminidase